MTEEESSQVFHAKLLLNQGSKDWLRSLGNLLETFTTEEDEEKLSTISRHLERDATEISRSLQKSKEAVESMQESLQRIQSESDLIAAVLQKVTKVRKDV